MKKTIALVAHDNRKRDLMEWAAFNHDVLRKYHLVCTGTTGRLIEKTLHDKAGQDADHLHITLLKSGPLGGDQQLGALIAERKIDLIIFLWDPMQPQPHDVDVKALLRISSLYNVPTACNRSTADYLISSPLFTNPDYKPIIKDFSEYLSRPLELQRER
ncbi:MAG: methylglyoxal synthase [Prevotellaceae bacterium]|jgi:methylglyoxal synthase|nr:methylglyoxal synthase [Prevotellaceae bacterium]